MIRTIAICAAVTASLSTVTFWRGRVDGWDRRAAAQAETDLRAMTDNQQKFLEGLQASQQEGGISARFEADLGRSIEGIQNELSRLSGGIVCAADPDRGLLVDQAVNRANTAITAASAELDDSASANPVATSDRGKNQR